MVFVHSHFLWTIHELIWRLLRPEALCKISWKILNRFLATLQQIILYTRHLVLILILKYSESVTTVFFLKKSIFCWWSILNVLLFQTLCGREDLELLIKGGFSSCRISLKKSFLDHWGKIEDFSSSEELVRIVLVYPDVTIKEICLAAKTSHFILYFLGFILLYSLLNKRFFWNRDF